MVRFSLKNKVNLNSFNISINIGMFEFSVIILKDEEVSVIKMNFSLFCFVFFYVFFFPKIGEMKIKSLFVKNRKVPVQVFLLKNPFRSL